ncbi:stromelysin-1-like isoform X2 [Eurosta solidaginis]|uniref:stromelysin-1-like isoform X2 n=1 Tax=Eurosta solidaginis TaxID=178769 RepID=UPI0035310EC2
MTSLRLCIMVCVMFVWEASAAPVESTSFVPITNRSEAEDVRAKRNLEVPPPEILRFMRRFGYLEPNPSDSESLYHESAIVEAIKNVQKYGALKQTGKLDNVTLELFTKPRCGVPDIEGIPYYLTSSTQQSVASSVVRGKRSDSEAGGSNFMVRDKRYVIGAPTWKKRRLRYFIANWSRKIPKTQVDRDIARALGLWAEYSGLRFERTNDTNADIIVGFGTRYHGDNFPFDGPGNILAHAYYPYEMGSWGGDVHFDEDENWKENSTELADGVDFYAVAAHEIGHSLGLAHSPHYSSIMFPYYKGPGAGTLLDYDDTLAMYSIYLTKVLEDDEATTIQESESETSTDIDRNVSSLAATPTMSSFFDDNETIDFSPNTFDPLDTTTSTTTVRTRVTTTSLLPTPELSKIPNICHANVRHIDAAYQRYDGAGVFFTGDTYWVFSYTQGILPTLIEGSPLSLSKLIGTTAIIDAAMMWPKNNLTYIFSGTQFWRFNDRLNRLDDGYPKSMSRWPGIPNNLDAVATLKNGKTYFFKDNIYWLYDNINIRPFRGYPRRASTAWLGCVTTTKKPLRNTNTTVTFIASLTLG